jgi:hypothetical protein
MVSFTSWLLHPRERAPGTHLIGGWVSLRAGLDMVMYAINKTESFADIYASASNAAKILGAETEVPHTNVGQDTCVMYQLVLRRTLLHFYIYINPSLFHFLARRKPT